MLRACSMTLNQTWSFLNLLGHHSSVSCECIKLLLLLTLEIEISCTIMVSSPILLFVPIIWKALLSLWFCLWNFGFPLRLKCTDWQWHLLFCLGCDNVKVRWKQVYWCTMCPIHQVPLSAKMYGIWACFI